MLIQQIIGVALSFATAFVAADSCPAVRNDGTPSGSFKNVSGITIYQTSPKLRKQHSNALLYISDIYGVPLLQNKLLADSLARGVNLPVYMPDLFYGDAVPVSSQEGAVNLTAWRANHPTSSIDTVVNTTLTYLRDTLGYDRIGAVGYCFGGKYVPRFLAEGKGIDVGFIAHPSGLESSEIEGIAGPISIAAGELDQAFNVTLRRAAEDILTKKNATYQTTLYSGAPHGFAVRVDLSVARQKFAKEGAFLQAVKWFESWL